MEATKKQPTITPFTGGDWTVQGDRILGTHQTAHGAGPLEIAKLGCAVQLGPQLVVGLHPWETEANAKLIAAAPKLYAAARDTYRGAFAELAKLERSGTSIGLSWERIWEILEPAESALAKALTAADERLVEVDE